MGGNALSNQGITTRRVAAAEYHGRLVPEIMNQVRRLFPGIRATVIDSYRASQISAIWTLWSTSKPCQPMQSNA